MLARTHLVAQLRSTLFSLMTLLWGWNLLSHFVERKHTEVNEFRDAAGEAVV